MNKTAILERLEMLISLCEKTEPDIPNDRQLFSDHIISTQTMIKEVRALQFGKNNIDPDSERDLLINIMKQSNKIWKIRNKVKNGEWDSLEMLEMYETIEDYLAQGQKINAIKYYRQEMDEKFNEQVSLREAKEHIDKISDDMRLRGIK